MAAVRADLSARDAKIARLMEKYPHLRVLRQPDPWECLVAYLCSANNNVARISAIVESVAEKLGDTVKLDSETRHAFPTPRQMLAAGAEPLDALRLGLGRPAKIIEAAERISDGTLDLDDLSQPEVSYAEAKRRLRGCRGIGDKVADCIALFALDKREAFPVDRWIGRAVARHYFPGQQPPSGHHLVMWAQDGFGKHAGYASQLLFLEERELAMTLPQPVRQSRPPTPYCPLAPARPRRAPIGFLDDLGPDRFPHRHADRVENRRLSSAETSIKIVGLGGRRVDEV